MVISNAPNKMAFLSNVINGSEDFFAWTKVLFMIYNCDMIFVQMKVYKGVITVEIWRRRVISLF